ncbi:hypothetical protein ACA910_011301 [Epithemia clementina (nom. ined.)]
MSNPDDTAAVQNDLSSSSSSSSSFGLSLSRFTRGRNDNNNNCKSLLKTSNAPATKTKTSSTCTAKTKCETSFQQIMKGGAPKPSPSCSSSSTKKRRRHRRRGPLPLPSFMIDAEIEEAEQAFLNICDGHSEQKSTTKKTGTKRRTMGGDKTQESTDSIVTSKKQKETQSSTSLPLLPFETTSCSNNNNTQDTATALVISLQSEDSSGDEILLAAPIFKTTNKKKTKVSAGEEGPVCSSNNTTETTNGSEREVGMSAQPQHDEPNSDTPDVLALQFSSSILDPQEAKAQSNFPQLKNSEMPAPFTTTAVSNRDLPNEVAPNTAAMAEQPKTTHYNDDGDRLQTILYAYLKNKDPAKVTLKDVYAMLGKQQTVRLTKKLKQTVKEIVLAALARASSAIKEAPCPEDMNSKLNPVIANDGKNIPFPSENPYASTESCWENEDATTTTPAKSLCTSVSAPMSNGNVILVDEGTKNCDPEIEIECVVLPDDNVLDVSTTSVGHFGFVAPESQVAASSLRGKSIDARSVEPTFTSKASQAPRARQARKSSRSEPKVGSRTVRSCTDNSKMLPASNNTSVKAVAKSSCKLCSTCPCAKSNPQKESSHALDMSKSDAAIEKALIRRLQKLEKIVERYASEEDAIRRRLKAHRRDMWRKRERLMRMGQDSAKSWFLPDAKELDAELNQAERRKPMSSRAVEHARAKVFGASKTTIQPTLTQIFLSNKENEDSRTNERNNQQSDQSVNVVAASSSSNPQVAPLAMQPQIAPVCDEDAGFQSDPDDVFQTHTRVEFPCKSRTCEPALTMVSLWSAHVAGEFGSSFDSLLVETIDTENAGMNDLVDMIEQCQEQRDDTHDYSDEITWSMLNEDDRELARKFISAVQEDVVALTAMQEVFNNWEENLLFCFYQQDRDAVLGAMVEIVETQKKIQEAVTLFSSVMERRGKAFGYFSDALTEKLKRLDAHSITSANVASTTSSQLSSPPLSTQDSLSKRTVNMDCYRKEDDAIGLVTMQDSFGTTGRQPQSRKIPACLDSSTIEKKDMEPASNDGNTLPEGEVCSSTRRRSRRSIESEAPTLIPSPPELHWSVSKILMSSTKNEPRLFSDLNIPSPFGESPFPGSPVVGFVPS